MGFDGFYVAAVMVVNGSIWMYAEVIINDYGPLVLFTKTPLKAHMSTVARSWLEVDRVLGTTHNTLK